MMSPKALAAIAAVFVTAAGAVVFLRASAAPSRGERHTTQVAFIAPDLSPQAAEGARYFYAVCAACHGMNGLGTEQGPPLVHDIHNPGHHADEAFYRAAATMDFCLNTAYLRSMLARMITLLALVAITVVTTVTSAHALRMGVEQDHAMHTGEMMHAAVGGELSCDGDGHCGSGDVEFCDLACTGLLVFLPLPTDAIRHCYRPFNHDVLSEGCPDSRAPVLNEHPPKPVPSARARADTRGV